MPNNFEEATKATEEMFAQNTPPEETGQAAPAEAQAAEGGNQEAASPQDAMLADSVQTAEAAAQTAAEKDMQLQQALRQVETLTAQNQQLQGTIEELSNQNEEALVQEALTPPALDVSALAFADEETVRQAQEKYAADMLAYNREQIMKELSPFVEQAKEGMYEKEKKEVISALSQIPELSGIEEMLPQLEKIIHNNKALSSDDIPMDEKFITAFAIAKGVNSINTPPPEPKEPTTEELMRLYNENPDFQEMVERQRLEQIKQSQQVPQFSASSGAVNAALNIKEKPKTFEEASRRTRQMFGLE